MKNLLRFGAARLLLSAVVLVSCLVVFATKPAMATEPDSNDDPPVIAPVSDGQEPTTTGINAYITPIGDIAYFVAASPDNQSTSLWRTDGTEVGTYPVETFAGDGDAVWIEGRHDDDLFLVVQDNQELHTLWISDGSSAGTEQIHSSGEDTIEIWFGVEEWLYFTEYGPNPDDRNLTLWRTNGTPGAAETVEVPGLTDAINPTSFPIRPFHVSQADTRTYFYASPQSDVDLWYVDDVGFQQVTTFADDFAADIQFRSSPLVSMGDAIYFLAETMEGETGLWRSDGTEEGTILIEDLDLRFPAESSEDGVYGELLHRVNSAFVMFQSSGSTLEILLYDTETEGLSTLATISSQFGNVGLSLDYGATNETYNNTVYFFVSSPRQVDSDNVELWQTDGTVEGTFALSIVGQVGPYTMAVTDHAVIAIGQMGTLKTFLIGVTPDITHGTILKPLGNYFILYPYLSKAGKFVYFPSRIGDEDSPVVLWRVDTEMLSPSNSFFPVVAQQE